MIVYDYPKIMEYESHYFPADFAFVWPFRLQGLLQQPHGLLPGSFTPAQSRQPREKLRGEVEKFMVIVW